MTGACPPRNPPPPSTSQGFRPSWLGGLPARTASQATRRCRGVFDDCATSHRHACRRARRAPGGRGACPSGRAHALVAGALGLPCAVGIPDCRVTSPVPANNVGHRCQRAGCAGARKKQVQPRRPHAAVAVTRNANRHARDKHWRISVRSSVQPSPPLTRRAFPGRKSPFTALASQLSARGTQLPKQAASSRGAPRAADHGRPGAPARAVQTAATAADSECRSAAQSSSSSGQVCRATLSGRSARPLRQRIRRLR